MDFYKERLIRASKKEHSCELCGGKIAKGEMYRKRVGVWEGEFYDIKLHTICDRAVDIYCAEQDTRYDEGWTPEYVMEFVNQDIRDKGQEVPKTRKEAIDLFMEL